MELYLCFPICLHGRERHDLSLLPVIIIETAPMKPDIATGYGLDDPGIESR
jgi:hypothetical protein